MLIHDDLIIGEIYELHIIFHSSSKRTS